MTFACAETACVFFNMCRALDCQKFTLEIESLGTNMRVKIADKEEGSAHC